MGIRKHFMCRVLIMKVKLYLVFKGVKKIIQSKNKLNGGGEWTFKGIHNLLNI